MNLLEKIIELKNKFTQSRADVQDITVIDNWYAEAKRLFLLKSLKDHDGIKYLIDIFKSEVDKITEKIDNSYSKDLSDYERDRLMDRRDLARKYLNLFLGVDDDLEKIESLVDNETH